MPRQRKRTKRRAKASESAGLELQSHTRSTISGLVQICAGIFLVLVLQGTAGRAGAVMQNIVTGFFGGYGMILPAFLIVSGLLHWFAPNTRLRAARSVGLFIAIVIDQSSWFEPLFQKLSGGIVDIMVARWLLYPLVLVLMANIQRHVTKENASKQPIVYRSRSY